MIHLQFKSGSSPGNLLRFTIADGGLSFMDGKVEKADIKFVGKSNRARAFGDSYSKVINFILQTVDPSNSVMCKIGAQSSLTTLKEVARGYPMVALNEMGSRFGSSMLLGDCDTQF